MALRDHLVYPHVRVKGSAPFFTPFCCFCINLGCETFPCQGVCAQSVMKPVGDRRVGGQWELEYTQRYTLQHASGHEYIQVSAFWLFMFVSLLHCPSLSKNSRNNHRFALTSNITKNKSFTEFLPTPLIFSLFSTVSTPGPCISSSGHSRETCGDVTQISCIFPDSLRFARPPTWYTFST